MPDFGSIVLVPFPFTDLSASKVRPALVLSRKRAPRQEDVIVCFITSRPQPKRAPVIPLPATRSTGLKIPSFARLDKIATLERGILLGALGRVPLPTLRKYRSMFFSVFGF